MVSQLFIAVLLSVVPISTALDKYVHVDLKAPLRPEYFKKSLDIFAKLGATGVVIEWEDMFPLTGILSSASHGNAYSKADVVGILDHARRLNLTVIPLVQTFGHAEWLLKTALFAPLRENANYSNVFCIGNPAARDILTDLLGQIAAIHAAVGPMPFFHIGADEAMIPPGLCEEDIEMMDELGTNDTKILVYHHLRTMAKSLQDEYPETKVLAWFDEFKNADASVLRDFEITTRITPVVWKYWAEHLDQALPEAMWANLSLAFPSAWGASAFKGANGANKYTNDIAPYLANNEQWRSQLERHSKKFSKGIESVIVTGWQRYDHFSGLCELLPTSFTALALSMVVIERDATEEDASRIVPILSCPSTTNIVNLLSGNDSCAYPGHEVRGAIRKLAAVYANYDKYTYVHNLENGWFTHHQRDKHYASRFYTESLAKQYQKYLKMMVPVEEAINKSFAEIFFPETAAEFIYDQIAPFKERLTSALSELDVINARRTFQPRPIF